MKRYYMTTDSQLGAVFAASVESEDGGWVLYADAVAELTRLRAALAAAEAERDEGGVDAKRKVAYIGEKESARVG